jgi:hypothetical protein
VLVFAAGANGNVPPTRVIEGTNTGFNDIWSIALDSSDNIYVSNLGNDSITVYAAGANGNVSPMQTISGSYTGLDQPYQLAVAGGTIIAANRGDPEEGGFSVTEYAATANGNVAPSRSIYGANTKLFAPQGVAVDASGNIYVSDMNGRIDVYAPDANGDAKPRRAIRGNATRLVIPQQLAIH